MVAIAGALTWLVYTQSGTRQLLRAGISSYDDMIPGHVEVGRIDGSIAGGVTLTRVALSDAEGRPLLEADTLSLGLDPWALTRATAEVGAVRIEGLTAYALDAPGGRFGDLAPAEPKAPAPEPPSATLGPDLPLRILGVLELREVVVLGGPVAFPHPQLVASELTLELDAQGTRADAALRARVSAPVSGLFVDWLELDATWSDPGLSIRSLLIQSNLGTVSVEHASADLETLWTSIGGLEGRIALGSLVPAAGPGLSDAEIWLDAAGDPSGLSVELRALLRGPQTLDAEVVGWVSHEPDGATALDVFGDCGGCQSGAGPLQFSLDADVGEAGHRARAAARVDGDGVSVRVDAAGDRRGASGLHALVEIPALESVRPMLEPLAPALELRGAVGLELGCGVLLEPVRGACRARLAWDHGYPVRRARLDVTAGRLARGQLLATLHELEIDAFDTHVELDADEATAAYSPTEVRARGWAFEVATPTGNGRIELDARASLGDEGRADGSLRVSDLDLSAANTFAPELGLGGRLDAEASLSGTLREPAIDLRVAVRAATVRGARLGDLRIDGSHRPQPGTSELHLNLRNGETGPIEASAQLPVHVDLETGTLDPRPDAPLRASLQIEAMPLAFPAELAGLHGRLTGELHSSLVLAGSLDAPRLALEAAASGVHIDGNPLPSVELATHYAAGRVDAELDARRPGVVERLQLRVDLPVFVDLATLTGRLRAHGEPTLDLEVEGAHLSALAPWVPGHTVSGRVDLQLSLRESMRVPHIEGELHARDLEWDQDRLGDVDLDVDYRNDIAVLRVAFESPEVTGGGLELRAPVTISPLDGRVQWHPERDHHLDVAVTGLLVDRALRWVPQDPNTPSLDAAGRLDAELSLRGPATAPSFVLDAELEEGEYGGRGIGDVQLHAELDDAGARASSRWRTSPAHEIRVDAEVPLSVDLSRGVYDWRRSDPHRLRIAAPRVDRALIEPFVDLGDLELSTAVYVVGDGNVDEFELAASIAGHVWAGNQRRRLVARVQVDPTRQRAWFDLGEPGPDSVHLEFQTDAPIRAVLEGADWRRVALTGHADVDELDLRIVEPFLPRDVQDPRGHLVAEATFAGTLGQPTIDARVELRDGAATIVSARQRLEKLELRAHADNHRLRLDRLDFESGGGVVHGRGSAHVIAGGVEGEIVLDVAQLPLRSPGMPYMAVSSQITTRLEASVRRLGIEVDLASTQVDVYSSNIAAAEPIPSNDNVVFGDFDASRDRSQAVQTTTENPTAAAEPGLQTDVTVDLVDPIKIVGPAVEMRWDGKVSARSTSAGTQTSGALRAKDGYFELLGNQFDIERGTVTLADDGSNALFVDLIARTSVDGIEITATVRGQLPKPELVFASSPALTQSEILTVLVTGSADVQSADPAQVQAKAASVLAAVSNPALQRQLNDALRVDRIRVGFGEATDQPILAVGKNLSKTVHAETQYHHNAPQNENNAELRVEYDVVPRWTLETFFGDAAAGGVDLFWGRAFDSDRDRRRRRRKHGDDHDHDHDHSF